MFDAELFMGFPITSEFALLLDSVSPEIKKLFIQENPDYLREVSHNGHSYLGKFAGKIGEASSLELLENNIISLLKKLVPDYPYQQSSLVIFPIRM